MEPCRRNRVCPGSLSLPLYASQTAICRWYFIFRTHVPFYFFTLLSFSRKYSPLRPPPPFPGLSSGVPASVRSISGGGITGEWGGRVDNRVSQDHMFLSLGLSSRAGTGNAPLDFFFFFFSSNFEFIRLIPLQKICGTCKSPTLFPSFFF